ncbi:MAG: HAMP domain-containing histidine kinase [Candidatus Marinimicrobia bacterium]|nr:HAMP domain-containing histidine kinase [Candidatus Neomarinimicrobiota bacterium]
MKKKDSLAYYIVIFVLVQVTWLSVAGLWITRFVINNVIHHQIGERFSVTVPDGGAVAIFVIGLTLIVLAAIGMSLLFRYLNVQFNLARLYDGFIANITHELKTPISSMQISVDTLKKKNLESDTRSKFLSIIEKDTKKLKDLIENVLVVSRLEQKMQIFDCKVRNAQVLLENVLGKIRDEYDFELSLETELPEETEVVFDENAFYTIIKNLVENSIKYSLENARIQIRVTIEKNWVVINYRDNGIGIPKNLRRKVFRKFYRGENKNLPNVKGTGIGLYLIKETMKFHAGKINLIASESGVAIRLRIPVFGKKKTRYLLQIREMK